MSAVNSYPLHIARRMADIAPFHVMDLLARARAFETQGRSMIHMEIGEPDFVSPAPLIEAAQQALREGHTHYTPAVGLAPLREAISAFYAEQYKVDVAPERIVITPGASGALQLVLGVLVNPGEQVLMADPGYPCNRHFVRMVEGEPVGIPVGAETEYQLTAEQCAEHWQSNTVAVMLASPANPTGTLVPEASMRDIITLAKKRRGRVIVDEIYHGLIYEGHAQTALAYSDDVFVINSFSKYFGMTGWRVGWLVAPTGYVAEVDKLAQNIFLAASTPAQYAALAAFDSDTVEILEQRRQEFKRRRDYLLPALRELGFTIPVVPQGAFYLYAGCERFSDDSYTLAHRLLNEAGVVITPGVDFGHHAPEKHVRFAYTTSMANLREGVTRLKNFLAL